MEAEFLPVLIPAFGLPPQGRQHEDDDAKFMDSNDMPIFLSHTYK